ncbi:MAG: pre-peptidase C-terminal domain-containing protein [Aggregatilineales bacterium]
MRSRSKVLMGVLLCLGVLAGNVLAQVQTYTGYMGDDVDDNYYPFDVEAGQNIRITADATSGNLDPLIGLQDPTGITVDVNDDRDTTTLSAEINHVAGESGTYQAIMSNISGTSGDYVMTIEVSGGAPVVDDRNTGTQQAQGDDEFYTGDILSDKDEDRYDIALGAGDGVIITAIAPSGSNLDTTLSLENGAGNQIAENDDYEYPTTTNSQITFVAEQTDTYTVVVSNYPRTIGIYELTIQYVTAAQANGNAEIPAVDLEPDLIYSGFMNDDVPADLYTITLDAGQGVVISADATEGSTLDPYIFLDGPDGEEVARNDDRDPGIDINSRIVFVAEVSGEYTIVMSNYPESSGDYQLTVTFITAENAQNLVGSSGTAPTINTTPSRGPDQQFSGTIVTDKDEDVYSVTLEVGQGLVVAAYETDGAMDTLLLVRDPFGTEIISNDNRGDYQTLDSQVGFTAVTAGQYSVVVTNYPGSPGSYRLEIYIADEAEVALAQQSMRVLLSGAELTFDTDNFRIHYTVEGDDATTIDFVQAVADTVEEVLAIQVGQLGWARPPSDTIQGGDGRYDVYLTNITDAYGYASSSSPAGDNPNTAVLEQFSRPAYLMLDNDYSDYDDPIQAMRATAAHEFHHIVQYGYDYADFQWYYESSASWMETVTFPTQEEATIYVEDVFTYPEICFGAQGDANITGGSVYGTWLFLEFLQANYGASAPLILWDNIALTDGWEPLETTLAVFDDTVPNMVARYQINNLVRDYAFVYKFEETTVWLEQVVDGTGDWTFTGNGVQELAANYFQFSAPGGVYDITLNAPNTLLEMYAIGIKGVEAAVIPLNQNGTIDTNNFDYTYLMVFNREYDDDVNDCSYTDYSFSVQPGTNTPLSATMGFNATQFRPLELR